MWVIDFEYVSHQFISEYRIYVFVRIKSKEIFVRYLGIV